VVDDPKFRRIPVTERNLWFLERQIPLFGLLDFFPAEVIGPPSTGRPLPGSPPVRKLTIETDQGWTFTTDIVADQKTFRNSSRPRGTGKWVVQANLKPGDAILIERLDDYKYRISKERGANLNQTAPQIGGAL